MDYFSGLGLGFSLILAIGSQNAFVLKQGLKQQHVFANMSLQYVYFVHYQTVY